MKTSRDDLILDNVSLIYYVLKKMNLYKNADEYYDIGMIGLIKAAEIIEDGRIDAFIKDKYSSFNSELGQKILNNSTSLEELAEHAYKLKDANDPGSGRQEYLESVVNQILFK